MNENNRRWYTVFVKSQLSSDNWEVLAHVKGTGNTNLIITALLPFYGDTLRSLEGKINEMTDKLKARYF